MYTPESNKMLYVNQNSLRKKEKVRKILYYEEFQLISSELPQILDVSLKSWIVCVSSFWKTAKNFELKYPLNTTIKRGYKFLWIRIL